MLIDPICSINSGQEFSWAIIDNTWYGVTSNCVLKLKHKNIKLDNFTSVSKIDDVFEFDSSPYYSGWERKYFRLDDNFEEIRKSFSNDRTILDLMEKYKGLRILRQDPIQCIFSFACASNNNIPRIKKIIKNLSKRFGENISLDGIDFFTFPTPKKLHEATDDQLKECGVGYRYKAIKTIASKIVNKDLDLDYLKQIKYQNAKKELLEIYGIGNKTADCVLLFSLEKMEAFPIDIWINRILNNYYHNLDKTNHTINSFDTGNKKINELIYDINLKKINSSQYEKIYNSIRNYFGPYCGYAQQYLYYHIRNNGIRKW